MYKMYSPHKIPGQRLTIAKDGDWRAVLCGLRRDEDDGAMLLMLVIDGGGTVGYHRPYCI